MKDKLVVFWQKTEDKINSMASRERVLIALCVFAVIYVLWDVVFFRSVVAEEKKYNARMETVSHELTLLTAEEKILAKALTNDPSAEKRREIVRLEKKLEHLEEEIHRISVGLIEAEKLPNVLQDVLMVSSGIKLVGMQTHEATPLPFPDEINQYVEEEAYKNKKGDGPKPSVAGADVSVFKHSVTVEVEGSYFDIVGYLSKLEDLPWLFYWELIDYQVKDYPKARVSIQVYTLSTEEGLLRV